MRPEEKCYVCKHVCDGGPVLYVTRPEGDWCFLCGGEHPDDASAYRVVGQRHVLDADDSIAEVLDLQPNQEAERASRSEGWTRSSYEVAENQE